MNMRVDGSTPLPEQAPIQAAATSKNQQLSEVESKVFEMVYNELASSNEIKSTVTTKEQFTNSCKNMPEEQKINLLLAQSGDEKIAKLFFRS